MYTELFSTNWRIAVPTYKFGAQMLPHLALILHTESHVDCIDWMEIRSLHSEALRLLLML